MIGLSKSPSVLSLSLTKDITPWFERERVLTALPGHCRTIAGRRGLALRQEHRSPSGDFYLNPAPSLRHFNHRPCQRRGAQVARPQGGHHEY